MNASTDPRCSACAHAHRLSALDTGSLGGALVCRRYPPTAQLVASHGGAAAVPVWPPVQDADTCGEFSQSPAQVIQ